MPPQHYSVSQSRDADALRVACAQEGCPLCTVLLQSMEQSMKTWNYEGFTDVEHRQWLVRVRGFCPLHTWQLAQRNNAFQLAMIYREILIDLLETLADEDSNGISAHRAVDNHWVATMKRWFQTEPPQVLDEAQLYGDCSFCRLRSQVEQRLVERMVELLFSEEMRVLLRRSTGLCRLHFLQAIHETEVHTPHYRAVLVESQRLCLQRSLAEIKEQIRKHDYHAASEPRGEEMTAWRRAAELCAGNAGMW